MGMNINELDNVEAATGGGRESPDDGDYNLLIEEAKYSSNAGGGTGYKTKFKILDGPYAGSDIYHYINVTNKNDTAQSIGRAELKAIMLIVGVSESDEIKDKMIRARLVGQMADYVKKNGEKTKIVNVRPILFMTTDGKNAKGEDVPTFVAKSPSAKDELAEWRKANLAPSGAGSSDTATTVTDSGGNISNNSALDDEIPF